MRLQEVQIVDAKLISVGLGYKKNRKIVSFASFPKIIAKNQAFFRVIDKTILFQLPRPLLNLGVSFHKS